MNIFFWLFIALAILWVTLLLYINRAQSNKHLYLYCTQISNNTYSNNLNFPSKHQCEGAIHVSDLYVMTLRKFVIKDSTFNQTYITLLLLRGGVASYIFKIFDNHTVTCWSFCKDHEQQYSMLLIFYTLFYYLITLVLKLSECQFYLSFRLF